MIYIKKLMRMIKSIFEYTDFSKSMSDKESIIEYLKDKNNQIYLEVSNIDPIQKYEFIRKSEEIFNAKSTFFDIKTFENLKYLESYVFFMKQSDINIDEKILIFLETENMDEILSKDLNKLIESSQTNIDPIFYFIKIKS